MCKAKSFYSLCLSVAFTCIVFKNYNGIQMIKDSAKENHAFGNISQYIKIGNGRRFEFAKIIIIVAYGRSGSTFTGSIFREITGAFYLYEPNRDLTLPFTKYRNDNVTLSNFYRKSSLFSMTRQMEDLLYAINLWLHCNLSSICIPICVEKKSTPNANGCCGKNGTFKASLQAAENYCKKAPVKVMKFIKLRMKYLLRFLHVYPNLRVVHLVRDPRGIFNSRWVKQKHSHWKLIVQSHCRTLIEDLTYSKQILVQYPNRLFIVSYENLANEPIRTAQEMFQFASLEFSNNIKMFLENQTLSNRDTCRHCTQRKNSSATAVKWRTKLDSYTAQFIQSACSISNKVLGYLPLSGKSEMNNFSIPSRKLVDIQKELVSNKNL
ncbi:carbohydrate sulfotransferase 3-like [Mercenaria mercenaria]|uniref:carbohydrate sulfotransferase 3-like n=1 Tax=Mercenaria mercenaria TaxID=6596 RepID=UPI00234E7613|nr:carbohydrate sulfotransferase 3-like [Mercenaria mercenaria]